MTMGKVCRTAIIAFLFVLVAALPLLAAEEGTPGKVYGKEVGQYMKPFSLPAPLDGGKDVKSESFLGKPTLISFIQSACRICQFEVRHLGREYDSVKDKVNVIVVFLDVDGSRIPKYKESFHLPFLVLHDADAEVAASVGISSSPATVLLDKEGKILKIHSGYDEDEIEDMLNLAKK